MALFGTIFLAVLAALYIVKYPADAGRAFRWTLALAVILLLVLLLQIKPEPTCNGQIVDGPRAICPH